jgi:hypothetical protein
VGFEVLTAVIMKNSVFWDMMLCSSLKVNQRSGRTCRPIFDPDDRGDLFLRNVDGLSKDYTALYPRRYNSSCWSGHTLEPPERIVNVLVSPSLRVRNTFHTYIKQFVNL